MSNLRQAAQSFVDCWDSGHFFTDRHAERIRALRAALAEPEHDPVAWASSLDFDDDDQEIIPAKDKGKLGTSKLCACRRHTSKEMKTYIAGESNWRTPDDETPPRGVKMLLLNAGGVCVIGTWTDWAVAWAPLPKVPEHIKQILMSKHLKGMP